MKLSAGLIRRIHGRLRNRQRKKGDKGLLAVGIGWATRKGRPDLARGLVLIYVVRKKKKRPPRRERIPREVTLNVGISTGARHKARRRATFATDVVEVSRRPVQTGVVVEGDTEVFTGGALVRWGARFALLTVGHAVEGDADGVVIVRPRGGLSFSGRVLAQTSSRSSLDAALVELNPSDVPALPSSSLPAGRVRVGTVNELIRAGGGIHPTGFTLTAAGTLVYVVEVYIPFQAPFDPIIPEAPNRRDLLLVRGRRGEFAHGTSGSVWLGSDGAVNALQVAGFPDEFSRGIGQPMQAYLDWAARQVGQPVSLVAAF